MKFILLILGLIILFNKLKQLKSLFKTKTAKDMYDILDKARESLGDGEDKFFNGAMIVMFWLFNLPYMVFYFLSMIFIGEFIFSIFAILMLLKYINVFKLCVKIIYNDNIESNQNKLFGFLSYFVELGCIIYVFYAIKMVF